MEAAPLTSTFDFEVVSLDTHGYEVKRDRRQASYFSEALGDGIVLKMVLIPEGTAQVGAPRSEEGRVDNEDELHFVTLMPYFISKYTITQAQWRAVAFLPKVWRVLDPEPSQFKGLNRPAEQVSWYEAVEFCARLSRVTGRLYRLPTEVEWEYACRVETATPFHFGETLTTNLANYCGTDYCSEKRRRKICYKGAYGEGSTGINRRETTEVGYFQVANGYGLHDMHGNVWEWCSSYLHECSSGTPSHHCQPSTIEDEQQPKPLRGGSWKSSPAMCRSASRLLKSPGYREAFVGFRVVYSMTSAYTGFDEPLQNTPLQSVLSNTQVAGNVIIGNVTQININSHSQHRVPSDT